MTEIGENSHDDRHYIQKRSDDYLLGWTARRAATRAGQLRLEPDSPEAARRFRNFAVEAR
jgi:hypothetical protein